MKDVNVKIAFSVLLLVAIAVPVFAYVYSQTQEYTKQIPVGIVVRLPIPAQFGVYWDYECTKPVTVIDFGEVPQPGTYRSFQKTIYVRNEQSDKPIWVYWNSTLPEVTTEIWEYWYNLWNGTRMEPGEIRWTYYNIEIKPYAALGTYNWTLTIWAEY